MFEFSLIIPTLGRCKELEQLLISIKQSNFNNLEVIVVDQNQDGLIDDLCKKFSRQFNLLHLKVDFIGVARARNYGFKYSRGAIINFPDDDCELIPNVLPTAAALFAHDKNIDAVFGRAIDKTTHRNSVIKFAPRKIKVTDKNLFRTTVEFAMFMRREVFLEIGLFDESFGLGTFYGSDEGADLVLRGLYLNKNFIYDPALVFYHPQVIGKYDKKELSRAFNYAKGSGRLAAKHWLQYKKGYALWRHFGFQGRALIAIIINLCLYRWNKCRFFLNAFRGRSIGWRCTCQEFMQQPADEV